MTNMGRSAVCWIVGAAIMVSSGYAATPVDTTAVREPVAAKRSVGETILSAPVLIVKVPLKLLKGAARVGIKLGVEESPARLFFQKIFGTDRPLHPLISYGSKPSLKGGIGLRLRNVFSPADQIRATASYSVNKYQRYRARYEGPSLLGENAGLTLRTEYNMMPRESFYGIGNDSHQDDEVSITRETGHAEAEFDWRLGARATFIMIAGYYSQNLYDGEETVLPTDLDEIRDSLGLAANDLRSSRFWTLNAHLQHDWRNHKGQPSSGGVEDLSIELSRGSGVSEGLTYWETRVDLRQYLNLFRKRILAARIMVRSLKVAEDANDIGLPSYLLPTLGGENDLRGYKPNRFWDRSLALASLEYRYPLWRTGDAFVFVDEGRVFPSLRDDFTWHDWHHSFGFGIRGWGDEGERFRFVTAWSKDEVRFYFNFGQEL